MQPVTTEIHETSRSDSATRSLLTRVLSGICVIAAVAGGLTVWHFKHYNHFAVHEPGRVYRSAWMNSVAMGETVKARGIKTVVNLCRPGEMGPTRADEERRAVEASGGHLVELPFPDTTDATDERLKPLVAVLNDPASYPLLVHCQHGVNRTSRFLAMYEVLLKGNDGEAVIRAMPRFGRRDYTEGEYQFARNFTDLHRSGEKTAEASDAELKHTRLE